MNKLCKYATTTIPGFNPYILISFEVANFACKTLAVITLILNGEI